MAQIVNKGINLESKQNKSNEIITVDMKKKFIKAGTVGVASLAFLNANLGKIVMLEKALINGLSNLAFGNSSICFLGTLPVPNAVLISVAAIILGYTTLLLKDGGKK